MMEIFPAENNPEVISLCLEEEHVIEETTEIKKELFYCPIEECPRHENGYKTINGLKRHIESAHPDYIK